MLSTSKDCRLLSTSTARARSSAARRANLRGQVHDFTRRGGRRVRRPGGSTLTDVKAIRAHVQDGKIVPDEPIELPEGAAVEVLIPNTKR